MQQRVPKLFPRSMIKDTKKLANEKLTKKGRDDLTEMRVFTIDPPNSRDLDDAISIEKKGRTAISIQKKGRTEKYTILIPKGKFILLPQEKHQGTSV